jgi:hypothetical protein
MELIMHLIDKAEARYKARREELTARLKSQMVDTMTHDPQAHGDALALFNTITQALEDADGAALKALKAEGDQ